MGVTGAFVIKNSVETASDGSTTNIKGFCMKRNQSARLVENTNIAVNSYERRKTMIKVNFSIGIRVLVSVALLAISGDRDRSPSSA
jgi:hypothetical protein